MSDTQSSLFGIEIKDMPKKDYDDMTTLEKMKAHNDRLKLKEPPSLEMCSAELDVIKAREKENWIERGMRKELSKPKKKEWVFTDLNIFGETDFITYVNFETDNGFEFFKTKKILKGFLKEKQIKKNEFDKRLVCVIDNVNELEEICGYEETFKNEQEIKDFIQITKENSEFAIKKNKENIFFDTRRYFWKYENKELKNIGWNCLNEQELKEIEIENKKRDLEHEQEKNNLENQIKKNSEELKELLKKKFGYPVIIRVLKDEKGVLK